MKCDTGRLRAYLDGALTPVERAAVAGHLAGCAACWEELAALERQTMSVAARLTALEPQPNEVPEPARALKVWRASLKDSAASTWLSTGLKDFASLNRSMSGQLWMTLKRSLEMAKQTLISPRWRPVAVGLAALACLAILFSFAPVRRAAADFLDIFRVRKFAVIPIDPAQVQRLEEMANLADANKMFGEPTYLREPGEPQPVADAAEASNLAGFAVRVPTALPNDSYQRKFTVEQGPAMHFEAERAAVQALLEAALKDSANVQGVALPDVEKIAVDVDMPMIVTQEYGMGGGRISVFQMPSPDVALPPGLDPPALGEAALQLLGMPPDDAHRLAQTIDWTSTLVIPLPTDQATYREVTVDGVAGLLVEQRSSGQSYRRATALLWERDGMLYGMAGTNVDSKLLLQLADSLQPVEATPQ